MVIPEEERSEEVPKLYEWRASKRRVKFCYGCRTLKSKEEGFYHWKEDVPRGVYKRTDYLCIECSRIKSKLRNNGDSLNAK